MKSIDLELLSAVESNDLASVRQRLADGANPNAKRAGGALLTRIKEGASVEVLRALIEAGADAAWSNALGFNLLFAALHSEASDENADGETAIDVAYVEERDEVVALLEKHGAQVKDP